MAASDDAFDQFDDDLAEGAEVQAGDRRKRLFSKELRCMMYGFGDDQNPYTESVDLLEDLVIEFIIEMTHKAMEIGRTGRVQVEDIVFLSTRLRARRFHQDLEKLSCCGVQRLRVRRGGLRWANLRLLPKMHA
ncbi:hypothetical protein HPB49_006434 [Dermacentor silvarum]|uniref:Uncharacterized protein n=1 Tax=Dermacentor silvarum TaxID=543639 RepID=A0ACB8C7S0_DERSI|nr:hypothetical protein HPB49_006434 [Dermacentor silvarum]